jgi:hypothetical protein
MAFSPGDGSRLLTVSADANHTARIWQWRRQGQQLVAKGHFESQECEAKSRHYSSERFYSEEQCHARTMVGIPGTMLHGCCWNAYKQPPVQGGMPRDSAEQLRARMSSFVTFGKKHLCFWEYEEELLIRVPPRLTRASQPSREAWNRHVAAKAARSTSRHEVEVQVRYQHPYNNHHMFCMGSV